MLNHTTIAISKEAHRKLKIASALRGVRISDATEAAIEMWMAANLDSTQTAAISSEKKGEGE